MAMRICGKCGKLSATATCPPCAEKRRLASNARHRPHSERRPDYGYAERTRRAQAVATHRATYGDWCPGWQRPAHSSADLTADHLVGVGAGGREDGPLGVLCRSCNSSKQHRA